MHFEKRIPIFIQLGFREAGILELKKYIDLLWVSNQDLNLVSRKMTYEELIDNHVIDCLLPLKKFPIDIKAVGDFGSGGGLPGVIYAIQFPEVKFHLFEKSKLKQNFLTKCKAVATNIEVCTEITSNLNHLDIVMARAFKPLDVILEMTQKYFASGGKYFLLKGRREKIDEEILLAQKKLKSLQVTIEPLKSPVLEVERHLVLVG
jgi:16S rRNA (guanine527-N7)-methyltransferase